MEVLKDSNHDEIKDGFLGIISAIAAANGGSHDEHYILDELLSSLKRILTNDVRFEASYSRKRYSLLPCDIVANIIVVLGDKIQLDEYEKSCISSDELYLDENMRKTKNSIIKALEKRDSEMYGLDMSIWSRVGDSVAFRARCEYPHNRIATTTKNIISTKHNGISLPTNQYAHHLHNQRILKRASEYRHDTNGEFASISKEAFFELLVWLTKTQY